MVFSSIFFVFFFLVLNLTAYYFCPDIKRKNLVMLVFSLIFYFWTGPKYIILLLTMVFFSWGFALLISSGRSLFFRRLFLILYCVLMLGTLIYFKYLTFFAEISHSLFGMPDKVPQILLPIGISFYTFQLISYVVDVYWDKVEPQRAYWKLLLYASLFHQCIAGPIVRYETVASEIEHRSVGYDDLSYSVRRFSIGLAKKAILANGCARVADQLLPVTKGEIANVSTSGVWVGLAFFTLQIYLDFSAYSDMAIAMGRMIGFHYKENFNYPYIATSIKDFWTRWHISLSSFFRDYVYIPLGGSRRGKRKTLINLLIVWSLTGLWHGASFNYIFWGLYFFAILTLERTSISKSLSQMPKWVSRIYTMVIVCIGWLIFRYERIGDLILAFAGITGFNKNGIIDYPTIVLVKNNIFLLIFGAAACTPIFKIVGRYTQLLLGRLMKVPYPVYIWKCIYPALLLFLSFLSLIGNSYNPFLYFRF